MPFDLDEELSSIPNSYRLASIQGGGFTIFLPILFLSILLFKGRSRLPLIFNGLEYRLLAIYLTVALVILFASPLVWKALFHAYLKKRRRILAACAFAHKNSHAVSALALLHLAAISMTIHRGHVLLALIILILATFTQFLLPGKPDWHRLISTHQKA